MAKLSENHKELIVMMLARYYRPAEVIELFKGEYKIELARQQISFYNPENKTGKLLSERLQRLFYDERERYRKAEPATALAVRDVRLRKLEQMVDIAMDTAVTLKNAKQLKVQSLNIMLERAQSMLDQIRVETERLNLSDAANSGKADRKTQILALFGVQQFEASATDPNDITRLLQGGENGHPKR